MKAANIICILVVMMSSLVGLCEERTAYTFETATIDLKSPDTNNRIRGLNYFMPYNNESATIIPVPGSFDILLNVLNNDADVGIRQNAAIAISYFHDDKAIDGIVKLLDAGNGGSWNQVYGSLGIIGTPRAISILKQKLNEVQEEEKVEVIGGLGQVQSDQVVDVIAPYLFDKSYKIKTRAIWALGRNGSTKGYALLLPFTENKTDKKLYVNVVNSMARLNSVEAHEFVLNKLSDDDPIVRQAASDAISFMVGEDAIEAMVKGLKESKDAKVRLACIRFLAKYPNKFPISVLVDALKDENARVREAVIGVIPTMYDAQAFNPMCTLLKDPDINVSNAVVMALTQIDDLRAKRPLVNELRNDSPFIRMAVIKALAKFKDKSLIKPIASLSGREQDLEVLATILTVFKTFNDNTTPATIVKLIQRIHEQEQQMEKDAAATLKTLTGNEYTGDPKDWK